MTQLDEARAARSGWRRRMLAPAVAFVAGLLAATWLVTRLPPASTAPVPPPLLVAATTDRAPAPVPDPARLSAIEARLAAVDRQAAGAAANARRAEDLLLAFAARRAVDRGVALGYLEGRLRARFGPAQPGAVAALIAAGQQPVTVEALRGGLDALAPRLGAGGPDESWSDAVARNLRELVIVRRRTDPPTAAAARLARARAALARGQVDAAAAEVARLPGAGVASDWLVQARRWSQAQRALDLLEAAALTSDEAGPPR